MSQIARPVMRATPGGSRAYSRTRMTNFVIRSGTASIGPALHASFVLRVLLRPRTATRKPGQSSGQTCHAFLIFVVGRSCKRQINSVGCARFGSFLHFFLFEFACISSL